MIRGAAARLVVVGLIDHTVITHECIATARHRPRRLEVLTVATSAVLKSFLGLVFDFGQQVALDPVELQGLLVLVSPLCE